mmetsp:Transcript_15827/g.22928  ORF Transcript_15827/g.22928 Transcript_15827/m.22928 type:complete len:229 (-) Transcript_15827:285-971(-)
MFLSSLVLSLTWCLRLFSSESFSWNFWLNSRTIISFSFSDSSTTCCRLSSRLLVFSLRALMVLVKSFCLEAQSVTWDCKRSLSRLSCLFCSKTAFFSRFKSSKVLLCMFMSDTSLMFSWCTSYSSLLSRLLALARASSSSFLISSECLFLRFSCSFLNCCSMLLCCELSCERRSSFSSLKFCISCSIWVFISLNSFKLLSSLSSSLIWNLRLSVSAWRCFSRELMFSS